MPEIASRTRKSRVSPFVFGRYGERMPPFEAELLRDRILACIESTIWQELQADALNNASLDDSGRLCKAACLFCHVDARSRSERSAYWGERLSPWPQESVSDSSTYRQCPKPSKRQRLQPDSLLSEKNRKGNSSNKRIFRGNNKASRALFLPLFS